jgi:hypothetical protein
MILPSEDDSRRPGDQSSPDNPENDPATPLPWEPESSDVPEPFDDDTADDPYGDAGEVQSPAPPGWREELKAALFEAVDDLKEIEDPAEDFDPPEPPDLFTFYGELVAMRNELRRGARQSSEALRQLTADAEKSTGAESLQRVVMALVYLHDRMSADKKALPIVESAMRQANVERVPTKGAAFDSATMVSDDTIGPDAKVSRELEAGFLWNGHVLRPARVKVS